MSQFKNHISPADIHASQGFTKPIQAWFDYFVFFLAYPAITFLGISITFWIFIIVAYKASNYFGSILSVRTFFDYLLAIFPIIVLISLLASYNSELANFFIDIKIWLQYLYWTLLSLFIVKNGKRNNWYQTLKYIFWGINSLIFSYYLIGFNLDFSAFTLDFSITRNSFLYQLICFVPFALLFVYVRYGNFLLSCFCLFYLFVAFITQGRAGSILLSFEILFVLIIVNRRSWYQYRFMLMPIFFFLFVIVLTTVSSDSVSNYMAEKIEPLNVRLANFIRGEEDGDLSKDESWLIRQLMITKGNEINKLYPFFGIGVGHFTKYESDLGELKTKKFESFKRFSKNVLNGLSAHNSYVQLLAEVGIVGLINVLLIFLLILWKFIRALKFKLELDIYFSISFVVILIHFYVISSITGAITWFVVGVSYFALSNKNGIRISKPKIGSNITKFDKVNG